MNRLIIFTLIMCCRLSADRGMIPINPDIQLFEPNQRALIAWNGKEEILLLTTDINASDTTSVLEILPLPSEPVIEKGELKTFKKAVELINKKTQRVFARGKGEGIPIPGGELKFHKKIGSHDLSVIHLLNADKFIRWVEDYLKKLGFEKVVISEDIKALVNQYIEDGFEWFVFDIISLQKELRTSEPIQYRFKTRNLFFPLRITRTSSGNTSINLLILTPRLLSRFTGLPVEQIKLAHRPELQELDKDIYYLFEDYQEVRLRIWKITGPLDSFDQDLIVR
ncbi:hypothetical protein BXT86_05960 [candidate division WOR-3 bacterium 4484_100]|uniref:DUF2330 domain-containing protein n=1 Tax=candidate division WOR-3 bacterium 4484_100 TaxID=1936077 RepID=A0A1V4QDV4_UNCW3|nr:MAG: hypothetical protein BXT86_05960 [candidate division WOR-3 bacterium 4484_100]